MISNFAFLLTPTHIYQRIKAAMKVKKQTSSNGLSCDKEVPVEAVEVVSLMPIKQ